MALARGLPLALLCAASAVARAEPPPGYDNPQLVPPRALGDPTVPYPAGAPPHREPISVTVAIVVDETGKVTSVELVSPPQPVFDQAVIDAARNFRFEPARDRGEPVAVRIELTHTFLPPPPPPPAAPSAEAGPARDSVLRGRLEEMGTRAPVVGATVAARSGGREYVAAADSRGRFRLPVPRGDTAIEVKAPGYRTFLQRETLGENQELAVTYLVERDRYDPYEIVVVGDERRKEVSRVTLRGPEIKQVPGTFGDPYRVVATLPGVATVMSLLPFPIVRGATPSATGLLLDGTRVPMLYHLLNGPGVIHPDFIEEVDFYPGGAPVLYGGYTGGIVDGRTGHARRGEELIDVDANLLQAGGLVRQPVPFVDATATAAARYGYPGAVLGLATDEVSLSYWDYQLRLDGGTPANGWTVFAFGARDVLETVSPSADAMDENPPLEPELVLGFHRLDLRLHHTRGRFDGGYRLVAGTDHTLSAGTDVTLRAIEPAARWRWQQTPDLAIAFGLEGKVHDVSQGGAGSPLDELTIRSITEDVDSTYVGSGLSEVLWRPTRSWFLRPGVRSDTWYDGTTRETGVDPRMTVRYRLATRELADVDPGSDDSAIWLKASAGVYHQPPRFVLPLPGLDAMPLRYGLLRSYQASLGAEVPFEHRLGVTVEGFFNYLDPTVFDLAINSEDLGTGANGSLFPDTTIPTPTEVQEALDRLIEPQRGRAYGLELLVRRQAKSGLFGWISYTLSRAERLREGAWVPYDFDRTHLLNLVGGLPLPRNWDLGLRAQFDSGKPATTTYGYNAARTAGYLRFDLRVDKRAVWKSWLLDFYVDITNVALLPEEVTPGTTIRYVLPTAGVRGRF
jgi:TonB family protein